LSVSSGNTYIRTSSSLLPVSGPWTLRGDAVLLHVRLTPKSARDEIGGISQLADGSPVLQARVRAVPENGKANEALVRLLAKALGVRASAVHIEAGAGSRFKSIRIEGDAKNTIARLARFFS
jgi:uncharacterized protein